MKFNLNIQQFTSSEWKIMRILFSIFWLLGIVKALSNYWSIPVPRGWATIFDLSFLDTPPGKIITGIAAILCVWFYIKNRGMALVTGTMFLISLCVYTYQDSQASDEYNEILSLVILGQFIAFVYSWNLNRRSNNDKGIRSSAARNLAIHNSKQAIIACYLIAGLTKLFDAGLYWVRDAPNLSVAIYKMHMHKYVSLLSPELKSTGLYYSSFIADHPFLIQVLFALALSLELFGIVALINRRYSVVVGLSFVLFHVTVGIFTGIRFDHFVVLVLIYLVNIGYLIDRAWMLTRKHIRFDKAH